MVIETSLGKLYASVKRAPVEIRKANTALISRGSVATLEQNLLDDAQKGAYTATVTLPTGQQIVHPIGGNDSPLSTLDDLAQSIRIAMERAETADEVPSQEAAAFYLRVFRGVLDDTREIALPVSPDADVELSLAPGQAVFRHRDTAPMTLQLAQAALRTLNIIVPPGATVAVRTGCEPFRSRITAKFGVDLVDDLIKLRTGGSLSEATGVGLTLKVKDVLDIAQDHPVAAVAAAYIMLRTSDFGEAANAIGALASTVRLCADPRLLQAEVEARRGNDGAARAAYLEAAGQGLPVFSTGLTYLVDRLRMYMEAAQAPDDARALKDKLVTLQRVAARCDFNLVFTNFTGASPARPGDEVFDTTTPAQQSGLQVGGHATSKENIMTTEYVPQKQIDELAKALASSDMQAMGGEDIKKKFCEVWPSVEQGLSQLQGILAMVPAANVFAGPAIGIVRAAGTAAAQGVCQR